MTRKLIALLGGVALLAASCTPKGNDRSQLLHDDFLVMRRIDTMYQQGGRWVNTSDQERAKSFQQCQRAGIRDDQYKQLLDMGGKVVAMLPEEFSVKYFITSSLRCYGIRYVIEAPKSVWDEWISKQGF